MKLCKIIGKTNGTFEKHFWDIRLFNTNVNGTDIENRV